MACHTRGAMTHHVLPRCAAPLLVALALACMAAACQRSAPEGPQPLRIGAGSTSEQQLLAALTAELLERSGIATEIISELGGTVGVRTAAVAGEVDVIWDYSGAAWTLGLGLPAPAVDPQQSFEAVAAEDIGSGLRWVAPSGIDARLAFFVREVDRPPDPEATLTWLAARLGAQAGALCADGGYLSSPAGYAYLADTYAIATDIVTTVSAAEDEALESTATGDCAAGLGTATSGPARNRDLAPLADDQGVFPALVAAPVVVIGGPAEDPAVIEQLTRLADALDTVSLAELNARVAEGGPIDEVAGGYLDAAALG